MKKATGKVSIMTIILISFVVILSGIALVVSYISYTNSKKSVTTLLKMLNHEQSVRISERLSMFFIPPQNIVGMNAKLIGSGAIDYWDMNALFEHFYDQTRYMRTINSFYFGNTDGGMINAGRDIGTGNALYKIYTDDYKKGHFYKYRIQEGELGELLFEIPFFDATRRPWYISAVGNGALSWSAPYIIATGNDVAMTCSAPVYKNGELLGVAGVDIFLSGISSYLKQIYMNERSGAAVVVNTNGEIYASSFQENMIQIYPETNTFKYLRISESTSSAIKKIGLILEERYESLIEINNPESLEMSTNDDKYYVDVLPFAGVGNMKLYIISIIPERKNMSDIYIANKRTLVLILISVLISIIIAYLIARLISDPIVKLDKDAALIGNGLLETPIRSSWIKEIDDFARQFVKMGIRINEMMDDLEAELENRKQNERLLAEEKERLKVTLKSIGDGVITTDIEGKAVLINPVAERLIGWSNEEAEGKFLTEIFHIYNQITGEVCENPVAKVLSTGNIIELANHTMLIDRQGNRRNIADSGAPIKDENNNIVGVVLVFRDVTEKEQILARVNRAEKLESLGFLAGGIAHDFNNLLTGVFGYLDLARLSVANGDIALTGEYINGVLKVFSRSKDLARQLLTFSKGGTPNKAHGDIGKQVKESVGFILSGSGIKLKINIDKDLWMVDYDPNQIGQVIDNLIINAKQAMGDRGEITISCLNVLIKDGIALDLTKGEYVKISVIDSGQGIPLSIINKIFDPFFTTKKEGSGLGLATSYSIVKKHNGTIEVKSIEGKGAEFNVYLPRSAVLKQFEQINNTLVEEERHTGSGVIYILDDEDYILSVLSDMLEIFGYTVVSFLDGEELLSRINEEGVNDIVKAMIFDLTIPGGKGGKDIIEQVRSIYPSLPIFASSGYSDDNVMSSPVEYGFTDSIIKPYNISELSVKLSRKLR